MIDQERLNQMLQNALPDVVESFKKELTQQVVWQARDEAAKLVSGEVTEWVKANVLPELKVHLEASKEGLVSTAKACAPKMMECLAEAMLADLKENLEKSWDRQKIWEAMFK